jgi:hypothetical protein
MKNQIVLTIAIVLTATLAMAASTEKIKEKASETADATVDYAHQTKEEFRKSMEKQLALLKEQIGKLQTQASQASGDAKAKFNKQLTDLEAKRKGVNNELDTASKKTGKAWEDMRTALVKAMDDIETGFASAEKSMEPAPKGDKKNDLDKKSANQSEDNK